MKHCSPIGPLPEKWRLVQLKEITHKIGSGATPRGGKEVYLLAREGYALVRSQNVFDRYFETTGLVFISDEHAEQLKHVHLQEGDILLNITGDGITFGRSCIVPNHVLPACVNQHVSIIRVDKAICDPGFLISYLTHPIVKTYIESFNSGGSRRAITKSHIESFIISLPPLPEQRAIARILGTLDDKIELNRKMNAILEAMAQAIFKSWFVDFDPVRAKMEGREPAGTDAETAALFPGGFKEVDGREVPVGWRVVPLPEAIEVNPRISLRKRDSAPYLDMKNMPMQGHRAIEWVERPFGSGVKFENGDTLLARITPCLENGKTAYVDFLNDGQVGWGSTEYIVLRPKPPLPKEYGYYLARSETFRTYTIQNMSGTSGRQRAAASCFDNYPVVVPSSAVAKQFEKIVKSIMLLIKQKDEESRTLAALRDTLLPKLISGEIRVPVIAEQSEDRASA